MNDDASLADISSDFRPAYVAALKMWMLLAGVVIIAIWVEASATGTLTQYLSAAAVVCAPGFLATALFVHLKPERAGQAAFVGYLLLSGYFTLAYVFALFVGPAEYSYLVFSNFGWLCAVYLYSSLFLGARSNGVNLANATVSTVLLVCCILQYKSATPTTSLSHEYGVQPYIYSIMAQFAYVLGARVINQLYRAMRSSQRKVITLRQLMAEMMGHEIGTPLQSIVNNVELVDLLLAKYPRGTPEAVTSVQKTRSAVEHLRRSVEQIQKVLDNAARSMNGAGVGNAQPDADLVNLQQLLAHTVEEFRQRARQRNLTLSIAAADVVPASVVIDRTRFTQILTNLVSNAIKYTDHGSITVSCTAAKRGELVLSVSDTGIGMPASALADIFKPYIRLPEALDRGTEGSGIGLAVVEREMAVLGGKVDVHSIHGQGSKFTCSIPANIESFTLRGSRPLEVLVVDDTEVVLSVAQHVLATAEVNCHVAADGRAALEILANRQVDLIFLDVQMPEADGYTVAQLVRNDPAYSGNVSAVIVGMSAGQLDQARAERLWFNFFLKKPFPFTRDLVDRFVTQRRGIDESAQQAFHFPGQHA